VSEERPTAGQPTERALRWAATMGGHPGGAGRVRQAHAGDEQIRLTPAPPLDRAEREAAEEEALAPAATRSGPYPGRRAREEEPDALRTCFEQDRDRILHSSAFRRLAGKTQVFIFPADHQRTRLTHALEVAQVATSIARACRLNVALTEAIALGHDCGHGPGGHASEDAFSVFVPGFDHAVWGADVTAAPLNLCRETLDGIRNHSWSRPAPATPEGQVVGLADRVAYCAHDLEDAAAAGLVDPAELPPLVRERLGATRSAQLHAFITDIVTTITSTGLVGLSEPMGEALAALRSFNHERIYLRPESRAQAGLVIDLLRALVEHLATHPDRLPDRTGDPLLEAVAYVDGMTDRYACSSAVSLLGWDPDRLPRGQDTGSG
jgi:dGTPase